MEAAMMNVSDTRDCAFEAFITNLGKYNEGFLVGESAMWAVSPIGHGMDLTPVWSGAPALYLGVRMSAAISTAALFRSSQAVSMGCSGSRTVDNGRTAALSRLPVRSFSSIGTTRARPVRRTGSPIMSASWRNAKTALSTPSRAIPATAADSANIRWDTTKF